MSTPMKLADFRTPSFFENPYPLYEQLRAAGPFATIGPKQLASGHYEIVDKLLHDRRAGKDYLHSVQLRYGEEVARRPLFQKANASFILMNPPEHTRLRSLMMQAFNARQIEAIRDTARETADRLIDAFISEGTVDLLSGYALRLPVEIICRMLNVPLADAALMAGASVQVVRLLDVAPLPLDQLNVVSAQYDVLDRYFTDLVNARRAQPGDDLVSALINAEENGEKLSTEEIVANVILLFVAGHETTANMLCNALIALHRHPEQLARLKRDPTRIPKAVLECLRYDSSVQMAPRVVMADIEIAGTTVPHGTVLLLMLGAANRDASKFRSPERLDIGRDDARPISFAAGIHHCLGYRLALLELEIGLETLLTRLPALTLTNLDNLHWQQRSNLRGVESLTASW
ncbi:cytochrome P450 [Paraburkholderia solisilvae]|nr:cytochrome P450 [Paraburkholderia solisilvae]